MSFKILDHIGREIEIVRNKNTVLNATCRPAPEKHNRMHNKSSLIRVWERI
jgi:hypothetical protein